MVDIGLVFLARSVGFAFFEPLTGWLYDRIGPRKIPILATFVGVFAVLLYSVARELHEFMAVSFLCAAVGAGISSPTRAAVARVTSKSQRGRGYGMYMSVTSMGRIGGPPLGGYLAQAVSYKAPFYASSIVMIVNFLVALKLPKEEEIQIETSVPHRSSSSKTAHIKLRTVLTAGFILLLLLRSSSVFNMHFNSTILPVYAKENPRIMATETEIGTMIGLMAMVTTVSMMLLGGLIDRFGRKKLIVLGTLLCGFTFFGFVAVGSLAQVFLAVAVLAVGEAALNLGLIVFLMDNTPSSRYGAAMGLYGLSEDIGGMASSLLFGFIYDGWGVAPVLYVLTINMLLAASVAFASLREADRQS